METNEKGIKKPIDAVIGKAQDDSSQIRNAVTETASAPQNASWTFYNDALNEDEINALVKDSKPELIVLLGLSDYGKSTFVGSLFFLLQQGKCKYTLYDSDSFIGFERRLFQRKINAQGKSDTQRTRIDEPQFLTMYVKDKEGGKRMVVLSDKAGEQYNAYKSQEETVKSDKTLRNADKFLIFVDAENFANRKFYSMKDNLEQLFQRLSTNNKLPQNAKVYILFNKIDTLSNLDEDKIKQMEKQITDMLSTYVGENCVIKELNSKSLGEANEEKLIQLFNELLETPTSQLVNGDDLDWLHRSIETIKTRKL